MVKILGKYVLNYMDGEYVLFPLRPHECCFSGICSLNETGAFIWRHIENRCNIPEIALRLSAEYGVDAVTAAREISSFLHELEEMCVIEISTTTYV